MGRSKDIAAAYQATAVTPADATVIPICRSLFVGTGGTVVVHMEGNPSGSNSTFLNVSDGAILPVQVDKVLSTGTTATDILALY